MISSGWPRAFLFIFSTAFFWNSAGAQEMYSLPVEEDTLSPAPDTLLTDTVSASDTVTWSSQYFTYNIKQSKFSLYDKAVLNYKGSSLQADTIYLDNEAQRVEAIGRPTIKEKSQPDIMGYRLKYNHKRQIGEIYYGTTKRDGHTFTGVEVRRQKSGEVYIARGCLAPCEDLSFYFYSRRMVLEPNKKVIARPIVMNISDVPVAVAPMFVVPLGKGRRSGLLRPKLGGDQAQGFYMRDLGYYWAINDYTDFKLFGDLIEGEQGTFDQTNVKGLYNYRKRDVLTGNLDGSAYVSEFNPGNSGWELNFAHDQNLTPDASQKLTGRGRFVSSTKVLDEALDEAEATNQTANANLSYTNALNWNQARVALSGVQDYNLTSGQLSREFPKGSFSFNAPLFPTETSDYWDAAEQDVSLAWYRKINYSYRGDFSAYQDRRPASADGFGNPLAGDTNTYVGAKNHLNFTAKYIAFQFINVTPSMNGTHFWNLHTLDTDGGPRYDANLADGRFGDNLVKFDAGVNTSTKLFGVAQPQLGRWEKIRHVVTPSVGFKYAPEIDTNRYFLSHPRLAASSFQDKEKTVSMSLGNDVDIKISPSDTGKSIGYKVFSATSSTSYNFEAEERKWTTINSSLRTEVVKHIPFVINFRHSLYDDYAPDPNRVVSPILVFYSYDWRKTLSLTGKMNSGLVRFTGEDPSTFTMEQQPWSASLSYGFTFSAQRVSPTTFQKNLIHSFGGQLRLNPTPKWEMSYNTSYDFEGGEFSRHAFAFNRTLKCWKLDFTWTPVGISQGWAFKIYVIDLPDIKLESAQTELKRR